MAQREKLTASQVKDAIRRLNDASKLASPRDIAKALKVMYHDLAPIMDQLEADGAIKHRNGHWYVV
ncbi:MAG TPA: hypothetical protein VF597_04210 [Candidatus Saccharimonadales bacterium]|jgi:DNA-binding MarR family transcriptional regulator